ncbi:hypothetical protein AN1V17_15850 [Vallitalea sediminicola]
MLSEVTSYNNVFLFVRVRYRYSFWVRNLSSHGERISKVQYETLLYYKKRQLFELISWTKLELTGKKIAPTVDDMIEGNYI